jgi:hypothetical protein
VDNCKSFRIKQLADGRVVIERHLANFEFGVYRNLETRRIRNLTKFATRVLQRVCVSENGSLLTYLERILSRFELRDVHPLAIDVVFINVTAINGNTLIPVISAFVPEIA